MSRGFYRVRYRPGSLPRKAFLLAWSTVNRLLDLRRAGEADVILVHREAFPFGGAFFERVMASTGTPIVYDFDDAVYLHQVGGPRLMQMLRNPGEKTGSIIELSAAVIAGNDHLKQYASHYNDRITVIPTPVDTDHFRPKPRPASDQRVVVGWIGSNTTAPYLQMVEPALAELMQRYPALELRIVGGSYQPPGLERVSLRRWGLESASTSGSCRCRTPTGPAASAASRPCST
jgi:glycosyltransferase involved in cell wall biosynthesis